MNAIVSPLTVSLVLGSGGARGYAHIGVIEELEASGFAIRSIAGSSMGALIGGVYAAGKLQIYGDWCVRCSDSMCCACSTGRSPVAVSSRAIASSAC